MTQTPIVDRAVVVCDAAPGFVHMIPAETARELERTAEELAAALRRAEATLFPHATTNYAKAALAKYQAMKDAAK